MDSKIKFHSQFVENLLLAVLWLCAAVMFLIIICGIYEIGEGMFRVFFPLEHFIPISSILGGLELIFVSPLVYLLVLALWKYINVVKPRVEPDLDKKNKYLNNALLEIMTVKILSVALFISILILHSIDLLLKDKMNTNLIIYYGVILVILIGYYYILDVLADSLKKQISDK